MLDNQKLALGTAQFGMDYGATNSTGKVSKDEIKNILIVAKKAGIEMLDTATSYGDSEKILGDLICGNFKISTKLSPITQNKKVNKKEIKESIENSLNNLKLQELDYCLVHNALDLLTENGLIIWKTLKEFKNLGIIKKIGYSIYSPSDLDKLYELFKPDIIQSPYNFFDKRLKSTGWMKILKDDDVEIHARSIFLQGILLMDNEELHTYFHKWADIWREMEACIDNLNLSILEALISVPASEEAIDKIIIGVSSSDEIVQLIDACKNINRHYKFPDFCIEEELIDPRKWDFQ